MSMITSRENLNVFQLGCAGWFGGNLVGMLLMKETSTFSIIWGLLPVIGFIALEIVKRRIK